ncbi:MerR family transcriptional regulator [Actinoplanes sp. NPDC051343]|uniref:MerR family transcriptional regulator n=1 Tax=Actinoplanes sp. NPDC051343 TaxID=3363906 RepID=UPI0037897E4D
MRIGELSGRTGVNERLLRYYEEQGLLRPDRLPSGYRVYAESDVQTVGRIRSLLTAGLSTSVIASVLPCVSEDGGFLAPTCPRMRADLTDESRRIGAAIEELETSRRLLEAIINGEPPARAVSTRNSRPGPGSR